MQLNQNTPDANGQTMMARGRRRYDLKTQRPTLPTPCQQSVTGGSIDMGHAMNPEAFEMSEDTTKPGGSNATQQCRVAAQAPTHPPGSSSIKYEYRDDHDTPQNKQQIPS